jgi:hypothetical protein
LVLSGDEVGAVPFGSSAPGETKSAKSTGSGLTSVRVWLPLAACLLVAAGLWTALRPERAPAPTTMAANQAVAQEPAPERAPAPAAAAPPTVAESAPAPAREADALKARANGTADERKQLARGESSRGDAINGGALRQREKAADQRDASRRAELQARAAQPGAKNEASELGAAAPAFRTQPQTAPAPAPPPAAAVVPPAQAPKEVEAAAANKTLSETTAAGAASGAVAGTATGAVGGRGEERAAAARDRAFTMVAAKRAGAAPGPIVAPDGSRQWNIGAMGAISVSTDGGRTWTVEYRDANLRLVAGSAPSADVCWAVGPQGTVMRRTADGTWTPVTKPADDYLVAVTATDDQRATVTTITQATYRTQDGGRTWTLVPAPKP